MTRASVRLWGWPIAIAILTAVGLLSALLDDGTSDAISWLALAAPLGVAGRCIARRDSTR